MRHEMKMNLLRACLLLIGSLCFPVLGGSQTGDVIREEFVTTGAGIRIHYLQSGESTSSRALVLIPGWRLPAFLWNQQLKKFAPATRVIAIDPRSQGESSKTVEGNTPESRAKDLHEILVKLG